MTDFGTITDYKTGTPIRPATAAEWRRTADKVNSTDPDGYAGLWEDGDGRTVWVDGGPDADVGRADIGALADEAGSAGDLEQVRLCELAIGTSPDSRLNGRGLPMGDGRAYAECVRVILDVRMRVAEDA